MHREESRHFVCQSNYCVILPP